MLSFLRSFFYITTLRLRGASIGKNVRFKGKLYILLRDGATYSNISIGDNVSFGGKTFVRLRKNGQISVEGDASFGTDVWLVSANEAKITIGEKVIIGSYCILNGGHGIEIGSGSWLAGFVYLNSSDHKTAKGISIQEQGYVGSPIKVGRDNWIGGHTFINKGITTGNGVVIGAGTIVTKSFPENAIVAGNPGKLLRFRE
jgi:acetyltransferase-like isoleucine patch superfamily enzyme